MISKVWRWYRRHNNAVDAVLEIAAGCVPGANIPIGALKLYLAKIDDGEEIQQDQQMKKMEQVLEEIKPVVGDVVEEIEELNSFRKSKTLKQRCQVIKNDKYINSELNKVLPQLNQTVKRFNIQNSDNNNI